jgi:hypothetical protein
MHAIYARIMELFLFNKRTNGSFERFLRSSAFRVDRHSRPKADLRHLVNCCTAAARLLTFVNHTAFSMDQCQHSGRNRRPAAVEKTALPIIRSSKLGVDSLVLR